MKEKEIDQKEKEKTMKQLGLPLSTMLLHGCDKAPFEITKTEGNTLIPRVINTNIIVYAISIDIMMESRRSHIRNIQHGGVRASELIYDMDLHTAANCGSTTRAREVVHRKRELLWCKDSQGNLPLHLAVEHGHMEVALYLVSNYPQASYALNDLNMSPLYLAVVHHPRDLDLIKGMLRELASDDNAVNHLMRGKSIVRAAIKDQNQEMLRTILKYQPEITHSPDEEGLTPLSYAASKGFVAIVKYILKKSPKTINNHNSDNSYPIHKACVGGHVEVLKMFHSKWPTSLLSPDQHGRTVLHLAAKELGNKLKHVVSYLLSLPEGREMISKKDENGRTPLDLAKSSRNCEIEDVIRRNCETVKWTYA